jgi:hypothetical protein
MFRHDCPLAVKPSSTPWRLVHKKTWRGFLPTDMLLSAVSVLVVAQSIVAQSSSEVPEGRKLTCISRNRSLRKTVMFD